MKTLVFLYLSFTCTVGFTQILRHGIIDSAAKRESFIRPALTLSAKECFVKEEYVLDRERQIILLSCDDSTELSWFVAEFPDECMDVYHKSLAGNKDQVLANTLFRSCMDKYYRKKENSQRSDTIYVERNGSVIIDPSHDQDMEYFGTGYEMYDSLGEFKYAKYYYTIDEIKNHCVSGNNFRNKRVEGWVNGKKDGKWVYYDISGHITCTETYEEGILKTQICH